MSVSVPSEPLSDAAASALGDEGMPCVCSHCGLTVPRGLIETGALTQFCCAGCRSVYAMIHGCGLDRYYALRESLRSGGSAKPAAVGTRYEAYDDPAFGDAHVQQLEDGLCSIDFHLSNVHCAACVWLVERLPRVLSGVVEARLSLRQAVVRVRWDPQAVALSRIGQVLEGLGYPPHPARSAEARSQRLGDERRMLVRVGIAGACAGNAMLLALALYAGLLDGMSAAHETFLRWVSLTVGMVALLGPGRLFFRGAWAGLRTRTVTLDLPIALALSVGGVAGLINVVAGRGEVYFDSLCTLVMLLLIGRYIQMRQHRRASDAVTLLQSLTPVSCRVWRGGAWTELAVEALEPGDRVQVLPSQRIAVDGKVCAGRSSVDRASLTGEAGPQGVEVGDEVFAGTINVSAVLEIEASAVAGDSRIAQLMETAAASVAHKPQMVKLADRIAGWFTLTVVVLAGLVFGGWWMGAGVEPAIDHAVALLIVACPCALGLATPLTLALAVGVAARRELLIKDAAVFEKLNAGSGGSPAVVTLDKTGTLTTGCMQVVAWHGPDSLKPLVARAEQDSQHPVGRALHHGLNEGLQQLMWRDLPLDSLVAIHNPRGGIVASLDSHRMVLGNRQFLASHDIVVSEAWSQRAASGLEAGQTVVWVALDAQVQACVLLGDTLRSDSAAAVKRVRAMGWSPRLLSGDIAPPVWSVAQQLGIARGDALASMSPEDKLEQVKTLGQDAVVMMVGDGVNDAAALAQADVGVAVHGGAEAAMGVADVYAARPGLWSIVELLELSWFVVKVIRQNLVFSLGYNLVAVGLAAAGFLSPWVAAILMPVSSASVLGLAVMRLNRWKGGKSCR